MRSGDMHPETHPIRPDSLHTREPQYQRPLDTARENGPPTLGLVTNQVWEDDPRHLAFTVARYEFVSGMLSDRSTVLELGCADAFGTRLVLQEVRFLPRPTSIRLSSTTSSAASIPDGNSPAPATTSC